VKVEPKASGSLLILAAAAGRATDFLAARVLALANGTFLRGPRSRRSFRIYKSNRPDSISVASAFCPQFISSPSRMRLSLPDRFVKLDLLRKEGVSNLRSQQALNHFVHGFPSYYDFGCLKVSIVRRSTASLPSTRRVY
jgi:hypothetical protein